MHVHQYYTCRAGAGGPWIRHHCRIRVFPVPGNLFPGRDPPRFLGRVAGEASCGPGPISDGSKWWQTSSQIGALVRGGLTHNRYATIMVPKGLRMNVTGSGHAHNSNAEEHSR